MKKIVSIFAFFLLVSSSVFSQEISSEQDFFSHKHEINFSVTSSLVNNDLSYYWFYDVYDFESLYVLDQWQNKSSYGIGYKYHLSKGAIRVKVFGVFNDDTFKDNDNDNNSSSETNYKYTRLDAKLGYQFNVNFKRTQLFYGLDATFHINQFDYKYIYEYEGGYTPYAYDPPYTRKTKEKLERQAFGISPFVGIKYFITPNISLFTETMLTVEYYEGKYKYKREVTSSPTSEDKSSTSGTNFDFGPVGQLGIGIQF